MRGPRFCLAAALLVSASVPSMAQGRCEPAECLAAIAAKAAVEVADVPAGDIAGLWKGGEGMLSGENLYLLPDGSYVYTEWGDLLPETIYDKGTWTIAAGVVQFAPDANVVWNPESDRRFVVATLPAARDRVLVGLDRKLECFLDLVREHPETAPAEWLRISALQWRGAIAPGEVDALTRGLHDEGWRPGFFAEDAAVRASEQALDRLRDIIGHADRVEVLPLAAAAGAARSEPRVEPSAVSLDAKTRKALSQLLIGYDWSTESATACLFTPSAVFRFHAADRHAQVQVCFTCGDMVLDGLEGPLGGRKHLRQSELRTLLQAAKKAFPGKFDQM